MSEGVRAPRPQMPKLSEVKDAWEEIGHDKLRVLFPNLPALSLDWGEPFCFRCGWLAPTEMNDYPASWKRRRAADAAWDACSGWLERAHLHDHVLGGPPDPLNLVLLCPLCHEEQPRCASWIEGVAFVNSPSPAAAVMPFVQLLTDARHKALRKPGHSTAVSKLLRARADIAVHAMQVMKATAEEAT